MLLRLLVEKFALVEKIEIDFGPGLNLLTGETGAGKSIIIDAMDVVLGGQASVDYIRTGEDRAVIEALFDVSEVIAAREKLVEFGLLDKGDEESLLMTREISRTAKNICRINGRAVTLGMYREVGCLLVDIYGQHHQQSLLEKEKHIYLLDSFGGREIQGLLIKISDLYKQYRELSAKIAEINTNELERVRKMDLLKYQLAEIENAKIIPGEDIELENERNLLGNTEKLTYLCNLINETLYEGSAGKPAALDMIHEALSNLRELIKIDPQLTYLKEIAENAVYQLEDVARETGKYRGKIEFNPSRLEQVNNRLEQIKQLKRKYGATTTEVLSFMEQLAADIEQDNRVEELAAALNRELTAVREVYDKTADELSRLRKSTARRLEQSIAGELVALAMPQVKFRVETGLYSLPGSRGIDEIEFLISPNPGEPLKQLAKIVSGGEMSRIMLALKAILAKVDDIPTMIFDEIDAGLGGKAIQAVAQKLSLIGRDRQVICVTHSPQIASYADIHFNISKKTGGQRTETVISRLSDPCRVEEMARMLSGNNITDITTKHVQEMLKTAAKNKN